jgi:hypothetical protein
LPTRTEPFCTEARMLGLMHDVRFAGGIAASGQSARFGGSVFTRDACRMMLVLMRRPYFYSLVREMLGILPQWTGVKEDSATNEFPDALQHQIFRECVAGRWLPAELIEGEHGVQFWTDKWGVDLKYDSINGRNFVIYNSSDAPLLYLKTLAKFCQIAGSDVLKDSFHHWPSGETRKVGEQALRYVSYILNAIEKTQEALDVSLYVVPNTNQRQTSPSGVMRDGFDAYLRPDGMPADYDFMAYVENQALCHEALTLAATELFANHEDAPKWLALADEIRRRTIDMMWNGSFFAAAFDKDGPVWLESNAVLEMLEGTFFEALTDAPDYIRALTNWLYSPKVMTPVGPRMISLDFADLEGDYYAYQGTGAVWPHVNAITADGLRRWGLTPLAYDLGTARTIGGFNRSQEALELWFVERETNTPAYNPRADQVSADRADLTIAADHMGSLDQGWAITAALQELWASRDESPEPPPGNWQPEYSEHLIEMAVAAPPFSASEPADIVRVDMEEGKRLKAERAARLGYAA